MIKVVVAGAGKIGSLIACMLVDSEDYEVHMVDVQLTSPDLLRLRQVIPSIQAVAFDIKNEKLAIEYFQKHQIQLVISSLPYYLNVHVAEAARAAQVNYFDLTEDIRVTRAVKKIAENQAVAFVPQCGIAPGFINILANSLIQEFDEAIEAKLRVGALPQRTSNGLHYSLTWSTDGLINEYGNPCHAIEHGKLITVSALDGLETLEIDGSVYEAFNTSGGLGSLPEMYKGKIDKLNYKTIRYPGHRDKIFFLMNELHLNEDRPLLKEILERTIPRTYQDIVLIYVAVHGQLNGEYFEKSFFKKIYPTTIRGLEWSAIQVCTAAGVCAVADLVMEEESYHGFVYHEQFDLKKVLMNRFGRYFA